MKPIISDCDGTLVDSQHAGAKRPGLGIQRARALLAGADAGVAPDDALIATIDARLAAREAVS
jgi:phosphoglycolate phosphatase-like HAD superfamily hydrolase